MSDDKKIKWKDTLFLPATGFPMKAELNKKEPELLNAWEKMNIYEKIMANRKDAELYILHDGPPYANGNIHLGHALNKILKDFIVKNKTMEGYQAPYVPGWDCHGLPIEIKVDKELGEKKSQMPIIDIRKECRNYAESFVDVQRNEFRRLGVFGDWQSPYTTLDPIYESTIIDYFKSFVKKGNVLRKKRPVYWCVSCVTALAEAEVEYDDHTSPSIYVKFMLKEAPDFLLEYAGREIFVLIWTTTPWTIPANLAIAVQPEYDYALFEMGGELYIAASRLVPVLAELISQNYKILREFKGEALNGLKTRHPLFDRNSIIINTDYVELETGTGCVHTAPGHGEDDYRAGLAYNLEIYSPVGPTGLFDETTGPYQGKHIFKTNSEIVEDLRNAGRLIHDNKISHSYPHCWRCKKPVIFRATEQWFIAMDSAELRQNALREIKKVKWLPSWGEERISNMIANRPDWCISRQRDWGVPIPVFYCKQCNEPSLTETSVEKTQHMFRQYGSDSWYTHPIQEFIQEDSRCGKCGHTEFEKGSDILDVWFESGASFGVLNYTPKHSFPADMYLEGGDQYRGWFHSSLLVGVSAMERSPYKTVITHGWVLDDKGRAMSKSLGNVIKPQAIIDEKGAEILRLWVAMVNYREDIKLGNEILARVTESYRKIRNTWKFMLGVISDFDPNRHPLNNDHLREVDVYILNKLQQTKQKIFAAYTDYEYHVIFHAALNFFTVDLSAFYLNFTKDILYCGGVNSTLRRTTQAVIFTLLKETALLLAPILAFTGEEVWSHSPAFPGKQESIHLHRFPEMELHYIEKTDAAKWEKIMEVRDACLKELEAARNAKIIGDPLEAEIHLHYPDAGEGSANLYRLAKENHDLLREILVVSGIQISPGDSPSIKIARFGGNKCPRCWNWFKETDNQSPFPELCPRCSDVIKEMNIEPAK